MDNIAIIRKNGDRWELIIDDTLKAYTEGNHDAGKVQLIDMAKSKGYAVTMGDK